MSEQVGFSSQRSGGPVVLVIDIMGHVHAIVLKTLATRSMTPTSSSSPATTPRALNSGTLVPALFKIDAEGLNQRQFLISATDDELI
jgi:hypothetical protein